jgi:hypothetical protein
MTNYNTLIDYLTTTNALTFPGDIVKLRSGSIPMTVRDIDDDRKNARVIYGSEGKIEIKEIPLVALVRVK